MYYLKNLGYPQGVWRFYIDTKETILKKARKLFAKHGFEGASIRSICEKATCNVSAISYHFGSKEELYRECLKEDGAQIVNLVQSVLTSPENEADLKVKLKLFMNKFFEYSVENRELILIISRDVNSKMAMDTLNNVCSQFPEILSAFFKEAQDKGILRKDIDPQILGEFIVQPIFMQVLFAESNKNYKQRNVAEPAFRQHLVDQQLLILFNNIFEA